MYGWQNVNFDRLFSFIAALLLFSILSGGALLVILGRWLFRHLSLGWSP